MAQQPVMQGNPRPVQPNGKLPQRTPQAEGNRFPAAFLDADLANEIGIGRAQLGHQFLQAGADLGEKL